MLLINEMIDEFGQVAMTKGTGEVRARGRALAGAMCQNSLTGGGALDGPGNGDIVITDDPGL